MSGGHTPGPWHIRESRDLTGDIGIAAPAGLVAECFAAIRTHDERSPEVTANARLIAAAPELLEALTAFLAGADAGHVSVEVDRAARAAIAKAQGQ